MEESELYQAATNSLASDASAENCYSKMAKETKGYIGDFKSFESDLKSIETRIKSEYKITSMPSAWRSAKSVLIKCMKQGIKIFDNNDTLKGKSELQDEIKALTPTPIGNYGVARNHLLAASKIFVILNLTDQALLKAVFVDHFK
jgi:hypothetical protein